MKMIFKIIGSLAWIAVSATLIISLWRRHGDDRMIKKIMWTLILCLPVVGWIFYGGMYEPPSEKQCTCGEATGPDHG